MVASQISISVVSPVYLAEHLVDPLVTQLIAVLKPLTPHFEIILVEDGSPDNSWQKIVENCDKDNRIKGIQLSRNFGQHYAITAGLDEAQGEWIVVIDCDLQDPPEEIVRLYQKAQEGYEVVLARRQQRKETFLKRFFSWLFYRILSYLTGTKHDPAVGNFGIYHKEVVQAICKMPEQIRYFPTMVKWVGFKQAAIETQSKKRIQGKSTYTFKKLRHLALDIMQAYSDNPIRLLEKLGFLIATLAFLAALVVFVQYFLGVIQVAGYASLIISIWFFSGLIMMTLGMVGLYVGKTFEGVKNRPLYIIKRKRNG
ncbi:MAG: glycosyltransferase family 2 protein [Thermonemataceae bacterium]